MSYQANVYNVMLATPGDLSHIRQAARDIISKWNTVHSFKNNIVLLATGWESVPPTLEGNAQTIINNRLLSKADLLIAIFWNRVGTPTESFPSGTIEEIEKHLQFGKLALLYFSDELVRPSSINNSQSEAVKKLKVQFRDRGITKDFDSPDDFKMKFNDDLSSIINDHDNYFIGVTIATDKKMKDNLVIELSNEAIELLFAASKNNGNTIITHPYRDIEITIDNKKFGGYRDNLSVKKYYAAFDELVNNKLIDVHSNEISRLNYKGFEEVNKFRVQFQSTVYFEYIELTDEFNNINATNHPELSERVAYKKILQQQMVNLIVDSSISFANIEYSLDDEISDGRLVGFAGYVLSHPDRKYKEKLVRYADYAKQYFTKHSFLLAIEFFLVKKYFTKNEFGKIRLLLEKYCRITDLSLDTKIEEVEKLLISQAKS